LKKGQGTGDKGQGKKEEDCRLQATDQKTRRLPDCTTA